MTNYGGVWNRGHHRHVRERICGGVNAFREAWRVSLVHGHAIADEWIHWWKGDAASALATAVMISSCRTNPRSSPSRSVTGTWRISCSANIRAILAADVSGRTVMTGFDINVAISDPRSQRGCVCQHTSVRKERIVTIPSRIARNCARSMPLIRFARSVCVMMPTTRLASSVTGIAWQPSSSRRGNTSRHDALCCTARTCRVMIPSASTGNTPSVTRR